VSARPHEQLRARLAEAEQALQAIRTGSVDTVVVAGHSGRQVFTLEGAEHAYRVLIESMNEGALTLTADKTILYANQCFARMVKTPLEQVTGSSFRRFLTASDLAMLRLLMKRAVKSGSKIQVSLLIADGSTLPVQISLHPLKSNGLVAATTSMVVTDMTEARRAEGQLRALTHRVVQALEAESSRVALELHDKITQPLCAALFRSQVLAENLSARDEPARDEAVRLREMLGKTAKEAELMSRELQPSVLEQLGLVAGLRAASAEFASRTSILVNLRRVRLAVRLTADVELALYRVFQEALRNVEKHARARQVTVQLRKQGASVRLEIADNGIGFDQRFHPLVLSRGLGGLGLAGMRERATYVGGALTIKSTRHAGTVISVEVPLPKSD